MSKKEIKAFEDARIQFLMRAPGYNGRNVSGDDKGSIFDCAAEHFAAGSTPVIATKIAWLNGTSSVPVLQILGQATPDMLRSLAGGLENIAERLEYDSKQLNNLRHS